MQPGIGIINLADLCQFIARTVEGIDASLLSGATGDKANRQDSQDDEQGLKFHCSSIIRI